MPEGASGRSQDIVVEVEFSIDDPTYPFISATENEGCVIELADMVPRMDDQYAEFFNITGINSTRVLELVASYETIDATLLYEYEDGGLFEFLTSGNCPAFSLAELGALPREAISLNGEGRIVAEIPPKYDASTVIEEFLAENTTVELVSKQEKESFSPILTHSATEQIIRTQLTERQWEVIRTAFNAGYYEWPRECTGEEVAEKLDITSPTFSEHIHAAERKLLAVLFNR
ncbi:bacterio-opsin activator [Halostagnicola larsenii XH-48]|uniref:Bacterio-opsin activator n=1 Tax=Halostagnicola larsenii XH-48 TaxID=797299 RepID=W0JRJ4_9EURY|nr:bacterio-opsin activator domain-containing protein [Halostagnicola larsenii]AHF99622.1 bacterio-opsin activator [Halostagnicola larsenii XH-48]